MEKEEDETPISVEISADERFSDLSKMEKYAAMNDALTKIIGSYNLISCGGNNKCHYKELKVSYKDDTYVMDVLYNTLTINDFETYTKGDYAVDIDKETSKTTTQTPTQEKTKEQAPPPTYDPKKDSANYDKNGNYKPVDEMTPDEVKKELEGMLEDSLKR
ncbi:hypothetical protein [Bacillus rhizoplanae]|uniref:hypothetical protein n=1 Tax=Bacillus rhizoplanae TaxID=2880966 RepID=UPI003D240713